MSKLSGIRDLDREILSKIDDREVLKVCSIDKYTWNTICDDLFLNRRLIAKYPEIEQYKMKDESWKSFFLRSIHYIVLLKEKYNYDYTFGDFVTQYNLLKDTENKYLLLTQAAWEGDLMLVIWSLKNGADIHTRKDAALRLASRDGHLEVVKYLVEHGADIHTQNDQSLIYASSNGHLEVVKYLVEHGANIHAIDDEALRWTSENGHLDVVKYLVESGADIHTQNNYALRYASHNGHLEVVKFLKSKMKNI